MTVLVLVFIIAGLTSNLEAESVETARKKKHLTRSRKKFKRSRKVREKRRR